MTDHIIGEAFLDISFGSEEQAAQHQESLERVLESRLLPVIREVFEELPLDRSDAQIERLELDLGPVRSDELEGELPKRLREKLRRALRDYIVVTTPARSEASRRLNSESSAFEKVTYFLRFGHLKWNIQAGQPDAMADLLREVLRTAPERMARLFAESPEFETIALRLFAQFPESVVEELLAVLAPEHSGLVTRLAKAREQIREGRGLSQSDTSPDNAAVRGYDLYDQLREILIEGKPGGAARLDEVLEELLQKYSWHLLRLYLEMQAGEGMSRQVEALYGIDTFRHLVEAFLTVSDGYSGSVVDLRQAITDFASRSVNQRLYYSRVLERLLRNDLIDLEALAAETGEHEPIDAAALHPPTGSVFHKAARIAELPLSEVPPAEVAWLGKLLSDKAGVREVVERLPEHVLARLLRLAGAVGSSQFLAVADALIEAGYRAGMRISPRQAQILKWELLFTSPADDVIQHLKQRIGVHLPRETREPFEAGQAHQITQARETWDSLIRAYELYDNLQLLLADEEGSGRIRDILRELVRSHPFYVRKLFRQLQDDGELRAQVRFHRTAQDLSDLLDAFLTVSAIPANLLAAIRESISRLELTVEEQKQYYGRLLSRLLRRPDADFEILKPEPSREEADEELHDALLLMVAGHATASQGAGVARQFDATMDTRPELATTWLEEIFQSEAHSDRAINQLPEGILIRALGHLGSQGLVESLDAIDALLDALHTEFAPKSPSELRKLKWTFLFKHAIHEYRALPATQIQEDFARYLARRFPSSRRDEKHTLRIQAKLADRSEPLSERALLQALQEGVDRSFAEQILSTADSVASAYYREGDLLLQNEIARLKWQLIFSDALLEETETHVQEFASRFQALLGDRLASLKPEPTQAVPVSLPASFATGQEPEWNAWVRAYDLYDRLRRKLVDGEAGSAADLTAVLEETLRLYPWQLLRLYREMQAGDDMSAGAIATFDVEELRRLTDAFLTVSEWPAGAFEGLKEAIANFAPAKAAARLYYAGILEQVLQARVIDLEQLSADAVRNVAEATAGIRAIRQIVDALTKQLVDKLLGKPRKPAETPSGMEEFIRLLESAELKTDAVGRSTASIQLLVDAWPKESLATLLRQLHEISESRSFPEGLRGEAVTAAGEITELSKIMVWNPFGVAERQLSAFKEEDLAILTVDALRERLLIRLLRQLREGDYDRLLQSATASLQKWSTTTGPVPPSLAMLKWEFILTYGIVESRDLVQPLFKVAFERFLETRLGPRPIRAARLYEELRRIMIFGETLEGGLKIRIKELSETHPEQVRKLYRELQTDAHALQSIRKMTDVADLRSLIDTFGSPDESIRHDAAVLEQIARNEPQAEDIFEELRRILILGETLEGGLKGRLERFRESQPEKIQTLHRELQTDARTLASIQKITDVGDLRSLLETFSVPGSAEPSAVDGLTSRDVLDRIIPGGSHPFAVYDELQRILILGETLKGGLKPRLERLRQSHPEQVRHLYRELQTDTRALESVRKIRDVTDLRSLIETFSAQGSAETSAISSFASNDETIRHYVAILGQMIRTDLRNRMDTSIGHDEIVRGYVLVLDGILRRESPAMKSPSWPRLVRSYDVYDELRQVLILGENLQGGIKVRIEELAQSHPEQLRSLYRELKTDSRTAENIRKIHDVADLKSLVDAFSESGDSDTFASSEDVVERLLGKQPPVESPKGLEADPTEALKLYLRTGTELIEVSKLVRTTEAMFWNEPSRLRVWIGEALETKAGAERLVRLLPDRLLVRALLGGSPGVNQETLLRLAESLALAAAKPEAGLNPRRVRQLKWEFLLRFVLVERRSFRAQEFTKDFAAFLASEPNALPAAELEKRFAAEMTREGMLTIAEPMKQKPLQPVELQRGIALSNVGMVLAAPYLPRLFSQLNLTEGSQFRNFEASERAIHLLQFMVNESEETPEHELVLNKILCGVDTAMPVRQKIELEDREKIMVESLIAAMIQNWKKIGQTSIAGFRESFLQRDGTLKLQEDEWRLDVTPRAFDMLLDYIPWSYSTIRHSWMERVVHVHWR